MTGKALQAGPAPDPPTILSATNQLRLEFDRTTVASWAGGAAELALRVEGRFASGRYFSGDATFHLPAPTLLGVPSSQTLHATSAAGAVFDFGPVTAANDGWGVMSVGCDHAAGLFPLGATTVTCTATGYSGNSTTAGFTIVVSNEPPAAASDASSTTERMPVTIAVLANDSDPDGDPIAIASVAAPGYGTVMPGGGGGLTYTPVVGFVGH